MPRPKTKDELLAAMAREYTALLEEIADLDADSLIRPGACEAWSVKDILGHLDVWHEMFLTWERAGVAGETVEMPAPGYTWKDTPALNEAIYQRIKDDEYSQVVDRLADSHRRVRGVIEGYDAADLEAKKRFKWTGSTSVLSYAVSATSSHYDWACKLIRKYKKTL